MVTYELGPVHGNGQGEPAIDVAFRAEQGERVVIEVPRGTDGRCRIDNFDRPRIRTLILRDHPDLLGDEAGLSTATKRLCEQVERDVQDAIDNETRWR